MERRRRASRIGAIVIALAVVAISLMMPSRYRIAPAWVSYGVPTLLIGAVVMRELAKSSPLWRRVARALMFASAGLAFTLNGLNLLDIIDALVYEPATLKPETLFFTALSIWLVNALTFAIIYWLVDRGGSDARAADAGEYPDFDFPAMGSPSKVPPDWRPGIIDYLFIAFTTNTAFGPTEAMPLSSRAKALMMAQSIIALADIVVVAARSIGAIA
ncbi:MAG: hypothetical protein JO263_03975 [Candidatus Eremiobacteraeota bacterium]|nr:hypothetical protein [Candidatus Eremiobacteraeota bacterium]